MAGWPLIWKTWKCQGILRISWKSHWKWEQSGNCQGKIVSGKITVAVLWLYQDVVAFWSCLYHTCFCCSTVGCRSRLPNECVMDFWVALITDIIDILPVFSAFIIAASSYFFAIRLDYNIDKKLCPVFTSVQWITTVLWLPHYGHRRCTMHPEILREIIENFTVPREWSPCSGLIIDCNVR